MKAKKLSRAEVVRTLNQEWAELLEEAHCNPSPDALAKLSRTKGLQPEFYVKGGLTITIGMLLQNFGQSFVSAAKIEDEHQLRDAVRTIREVRNQLPTVMRKAMKQVVAVLPRRGGPGRQPKLKLHEASQMCDQIAMFIRQNNNLKQALQKVSELTPQLLGKKVSPRTLQKAWNKRGE
jgi:hypothetical protein